jgi:4-diphosphocytidyl-2-C-methyl-D-erythritol kinase
VDTRNGPIAGTVPAIAFAPAKINLTLRVTGRRADGYHELESLVVFARPRDRLRLMPGEKLSLVVDGPTAGNAGSVADNLVLKAARALGDNIPALKAGRFDLRKCLPVAAGIGGGSSDAAAALRLLARLNGLALDDPRLHRAARATGADVPVCLDPRPRLMRGIGEILSPPLFLPPLAGVLVNPGVAVPTGPIFAALAKSREEADVAATTDDPASVLVAPATAPDKAPSVDALIEALGRSRNDLESPAIGLQPVIADVLSALRDLPGCRLARMSGSGATCFGLFDRSDAPAAARRLKALHPRWWVRATSLGAG